MSRASCPRFEGGTPSTQKSIFRHNNPACPKICTGPGSFCIGIALAGMVPIGYSDGPCRHADACLNAGGAEESGTRQGTHPIELSRESLAVRREKRADVPLTTSHGDRRPQLAAAILSESGISHAPVCGSWPAENSRVCIDDIRRIRREGPFSRLAVRGLSVPGTAAPPNSNSQIVNSGFRGVPRRNDSGGPVSVGRGPWFVLRSRMPRTGMKAVE